MGRKVHIGAFIVALSLGVTLLSIPHGDDPDVPLVNHERTSRGIHALIEDTSLDALALQHDKDMAAQGTIYHDPSTPNKAGNWNVYGENVGAGPTLQDIHNAYMNSPEHRANILDPRFDHMGAAEFTKDGVVYNTEIFVQRTRPSPPPAPRPSATATPTHRATIKPKPKPRPRPKPSVCGVTIVPTRVSSETIVRVGRSTISATTIDR